MKKTTLLTTMLLLCALIAGGSSAWAAETEILSWTARTSSNGDDTYTSGFTYATNNISGKGGYVQDNGEKNKDIVSFALYRTKDKLFSSTPSTVTFHANLGGGSTKDPLDHDVYACFIDNNGEEIDGSEVVVTTKITNKNGSDFSVSMPVDKTANAYGVKLYHMKEDSYNVRYYSFSLSYEAATASEATAPEFSLPAGAYIYGTTVSISSTNCKKIYYTTDGTNPTTSSPVYSAPIVITGDMTIKAFATDDSDKPTVIISRSYSLKTPDAPTFSPKPGNVSAGTVITITVESGCVISYTIDGTDPSSSGTATLSDTNTATVMINETKTIRAIAIDGGLNESEETAAMYAVLDIDALTESKVSFTTTSGKLNSDIAFESAQGGAGTAPGNYNSGIRLYQISGSNDYGGYITLTAPTGFKIIQVKITSTSQYASTNVTYTVDGGTDVSVNPTYALAKSSSYTVSGLNNTSVSIFNLGSGSSGRLEIGAIEVAYIGNGTFSIAPECTDGKKYFGTYSSSRAFVVPEGLTVSEVKVTDGELNLSNYTAGAVVPANTGIVVSASTAGEKVIKFSGRTGTSVLGEDNMLKPSGDEGITASAMEVAGTKFYRLTMHNNLELGFWWGAADGGAFDLASNKAYLAIPDGVGAHEGLTFGDATSIGSVKNVKVEDGVYYNLAGQRVIQPAKGLYIVNGKKYVVK